MNKFHVGEDVILVSELFPHKNGEYVIEDVLFQPFVICEDMTYQNIYTYKLLGAPIEVGYNGYWIENSLRKKHKPSSESYSELLKSLKSGVINA